jgi:hypothetical protein
MTRLALDLVIAIGIVVLVMFLAATLVGAQAQEQLCPVCWNKARLLGLVYASASAGACVGFIAANLPGSRHD